MHPLRITVVDGGLIHGVGRCEGIRLKLQGYGFLTNDIVIPLSSCDVILDMQWLRQWGVIQWNFSNMAMEFSMNGMHMKLQVVKENKSMAVSASKLHQLVVEYSFCYMLQLLPCSIEALCCFVTKEELEDPVMRAHREFVLHEFLEVFETPTQLPPFRVIHDHQTVLKQVYNPSLEAYVVHLRQVFQIVKGYIFYVKRSKCAFFTTRVEYLGHLITTTGVTTDPIKVQDVRAWATSQTIKKLRGFLGLTAHIAFTTLKDALSNSPVLAILNMQNPFVVETYASSTRIGVVLMHDRHPVAFISKVLSPKNRLLSVYDREVLALVHAVSKWHQYLSLNTFTILTGQHSLKHLLEKRLSTPGQYRWVTKLMGLSYEILYKNDKDNVVANVLSRASHGEVLQLTVSSISSELWDSLLKSYDQDSALQDLELQVLSNPALHPHFYVTKFIQQCETCLRCKYEPKVDADLKSKSYIQDLEESGHEVLDHC
ncbi:hypothetical protein KIW84_021061 [Lathyrus oleraceus]|uniref:Reverse transcriptase/retrotransposon-derived protein RNase H-like domain-containing protein n=1 Tax=Pisum sativum TaxID=3888 RepID=A0A9D4Y6S1_PEA|nr:hypothetical protein KIW84_021061 [Pisum sativum]